MFDTNDLLKMATRDYMLGNTTMEEQIQFIEDQIKEPFESGDNNFLRRLKDMVSSADEMDEECQRLIALIQDTYPHLNIDLSFYDRHLYDLFRAIYKFFVVKIKKQTYVFLREFILSSKNRKALTDPYMNMKMPNYPKEQYGKKEFYVLITKLPQIIKDVLEDLKFKKFIKYIKESSNCPSFVKDIEDAMDQDIISDNGVVGDIYKLMKRAGHSVFYEIVSKLEMDITSELIIPYMQENGMMDIRLPPVEDTTEDIDSDEDDD